jgi:hypothetical protein
VSEDGNFLDYANGRQRRRRDNFLLRQVVLCAIITLTVAVVVISLMFLRGL